MSVIPDSNYTNICVISESNLMIVFSLQSIFSCFLAFLFFCCCCCCCCCWKLDLLLQVLGNGAIGIVWGLMLTWLGVAAAAAKLFQSCLTLCDPIDGSPPGSSISGILQARTLEWVAMSWLGVRLSLIFNVAIGIIGLHFLSCLCFCLPSWLLSCLSTPSQKAYVLQFV